MRYLTAWDAGRAMPNSSTLNDKAGVVTSNSAIVPAGASGAISIYVTDRTEVIIDINGYYAPTTSGSGPYGGSAEAPGLPIGDMSSGLYSDSAGGVSIATGGVGRLTVRADGDLELPGRILKAGIPFLQGGGRGYNTAVGELALIVNEGYSNAAFGEYALADNVTASGNTAMGAWSLSHNIAGDFNTGLGGNALGANLFGSENTALGDFTLGYLQTGSYNIAIGSGAGQGVIVGSNNIYIGNAGAEESNTIRIGDSQYHGRTFLAGVRGVTTGSGGIPVLVDSSGQLGTASSSRRVKRDIEEMGDTTEAILGLRPVRFRYKAHGAEAPVQYGLIAEEVADVAPDLVARDKDGQIETVYYDKVNAMLLNEVQKLVRLNQKLEERVAELETAVKTAP